MPQPRRAEQRSAGFSPPPRWSMMLRAVREAGGVTQDGWAAHLGYSRATVQRWERGQAIPDSAAEQALINLCAERGLLRAFDHGPLAGVTLTAEFLRDLFAEARAGGPPGTAHDQPSNLTRLFGRLRERASGAESSAGGAVDRPDTEPVPTNLPVPATSFVGRAGELRDLGQLLDSARLVTLVGAGGIGKTRLATESGRARAAHYRDGVWLIDLAPLTDPALVPAAVAAVFAVREEPGRRLLDSVTDALAGRAALLILDNCEHLLEASARLAGALLQIDGPRILATSRAPLGHAAETVYRLPPLAVPDPADRISGEAVSGLESPADRAAPERPAAVRLFVERARGALPTFRLTEANAGAVAGICRRLDGLPLAIELAAVRVRILTPEQIAARLGERFRLFDRGGEGEPRHRTLQATLDWSYDLLTTAEQCLFARLSVFAGSSDIDAIEVVCTGNGIDRSEVFDLVTYLVDKSLLIVEHQGETARYRLAETVRGFAAERLARTGDVTRTREQQIAYYTALAEREDARLVGPDQPAALAHLTLENDNLRVALASALQNRAIEQAATLAARLWRFWMLAGRAGEGRDWLARTLGAEGVLPPTLRARLLDATGTLAHVQGDYAESERAHRQSLPIWRDLDDTLGLAGAVGSLGLALKSRGDLDGATDHLEEALMLWRTAGQDARAAMLLNNLAAVAMDQGNFQRAGQYLEESLKLKRRTGDQAGIAVSLYNLAETAVHLGQLERASVLSDESITIFRGLGLRANLAQALHMAGVIAARRENRIDAMALLRESLALFREANLRWGVPLCLEALASVAIAGSDARGTARLLGAAEAIREDIGAPIAPSDEPARDATLAAARAALNEDTFAALWVAGRALSFDQAIAAGLAMTRTAPGQGSGRV